MRFLLVIFGAGAALAALAVVPNASAELGQRPTGPGAAFSACPDPATSPDSVSTPCVAIAEFDPAASRAERVAVIRGAGAAVRFNFGIVPAAAVMVPNEATYWLLAGSPEVRRLIPDRRVHTFAPPEKCSPWPGCKNGDGGGTGGGGGGLSQPVPVGVQVVGAPAVWKGDNKGGSVTVAILDTGIDTDHPDLDADGSKVDQGMTCLGDEAEATCIPGGEDDHGHGTHVAGIVAAIDNTIDVVGVAPNARLEAVKVLDSSGGGYHSNVIAGLDWVCDPDDKKNCQLASRQSAAGVVNMSLGREGDCSADGGDASGRMVGEAIDRLVTAGIPVVVSAGNDNTKDVSQMVPAGCPGVIAVASSTAATGTNKCRFLASLGDVGQDTASFFTTDGEGVSVSAPGEEYEDNTCGTIQSTGILSLAMGGGTTRMSGTSMASPHVAGIVALMLHQQSGFSPAGVKTALEDNARGKGADLPKDNPLIQESYDGEDEGIACAPAAIISGGSC